MHFKGKASVLEEKIYYLDKEAEELYIFLHFYFLRKKRLSSFDFNAYTTEGASN